MHQRVRLLCNSYKLLTQIQILNSLGYTNEGQIQVKIINTIPGKACNWIQLELHCNKYKCNIIPCTSSTNTWKGLKHTFSGTSKSDIGSRIVRVWVGFKAFAVTKCTKWFFFIRCIWKWDLPNTNGKQHYWACINVIFAPLGVACVVFMYMWLFDLVNFVTSLTRCLADSP